MDGQLDASFLCCRGDGAQEVARISFEFGSVNVLVFFQQLAHVSQRNFEGVAGEHVEDAGDEGRFPASSKPL